MDACGINSDFNRRLKTVNFWTSHEALLLPFEETMTRVDSTTGEEPRYLSSLCLDRR